MGGRRDVSLRVVGSGELGSRDGVLEGRGEIEGVV